jgi:hypothetical protein
MVWTIWLEEVFHRIDVFIGSTPVGDKMMANDRANGAARCKGAMKKHRGDLDGTSVSTKCRETGRSLPQRRPREE